LVWLGVVKSVSPSPEEVPSIVDKFYGDLYCSFAVEEVAIVGCGDSSVCYPTCAAFYFVREVIFVSSGDEGPLVLVLVKGYG
jgi:hypothetical protein